MLSSGARTNWVDTHIGGCICSTASVMSSHVEPCRQALENLCPWHPWLGRVEPWLKRHWNCVATASRRLRAVVPVSSKDAFGTSKDWQRAWTKMARGWNDLSSTSSYWWGATYTPVYNCIHLYAFTAMQSHLEWRDNSALLVHSHNKQQYCLEILKFIIVCDSSW